MNAGVKPSNPGDTAPPWRAPYTLTLLTVIYAFNYLDRNIFSIVLQSIKTEMYLSDTALGLVGGLAFVLFYATLGVPIAYLADRYSRRNIIAIGLSVWSLMTALTGMVTNVWQLAVTRFLMGAGEACGTAPSNSMLSDLYDQARRPVALSILTSGSTIGVFVGYLARGWINELYGWRTVFFVAGIPGILIALLFYFTVKEPERGASEKTAVSLDPNSFMQTVRYLSTNRTYIFVAAGGCLMGVYMFSHLIWNPAFMMRVHDIGSGEVGTYLALSRGPIGVLGIFMGGYLVRTLSRRDERWRVWVPALACIIAVPADLVFLLSDRLGISVAGMVIASFVTYMHLGPIYAILISVARIRMRATATAVFILCGNILGQVFGPLGVGYLNDILAVSHGDLAIRYSLVSASVFGVGAGIFLLLASRFVVADTRRALD